MSNRDINIEVLKEFRKRKAKKGGKSKNVVNIHVKSTGPPDMSNHNAIVKVFKTAESYEAFRNKYLYSDFSYPVDHEDRSIEIIRNRCKNKKKRQENMFRQALKNKDTLTHNERLYKTIFRDRDFYNNYSREKLDYEAAEKLLRKDTSNSIINDDDDDNNALELYDAMNMNNIEEIPTNPPPTVEKQIKEEEEEEGEKEQMVIEENEDSIEKEKNYSEDKLEIVDNINDNMIERNSTYKSFSFNDSLKPSETNRNSCDTMNNSMFPPTSTSRKSSSLVPLCMDDVINSGSVKLPVIEPHRRNWHALSINEVYEQRPLWNPYSDEPKTKLIIPGIEKKYQRFIPSKNGNNFWRVCDGNIYDNLY